MKNNIKRSRINMIECKDLIQSKNGDLYIICLSSIKDTRNICLFDISTSSIIFTKFLTIQELRDSNEYTLIEKGYNLSITNVV